MLTQKCKDCLVVKPLGYFYFRKDNSSHRKQCKICWYKKTKRWAKENILASRAIALRWAKANYPYLRMKKAEYRNKDPLAVRKWSLQNPEKKKAIDKLWRQKNRALILADVRRRQTQKLNASPKWANKEKILAIYIQAKKVGAHVDHIIPLRNKNVCGLHVENNLQLLSPLENLKKGNKF